MNVTDKTTTVVISEPLAAAALARLYASGELWHVHLCQYCETQWKARVRRMDLFCSRECQIKAYSTSPDYRERHARQQRESHKSIEELNARLDAMHQKGSK